LLVELAAHGNITLLKGHPESLEYLAGGKAPAIAPAPGDLIISRGSGSGSSGGVGAAAADLNDFGFALRVETEVPA